MMKNVKLLLILSLVLAGAAAQAADKLDNLLIYGDNFIVSAKEPDGWRGDSTNASLHHANFVFYRSSETIQNAKTVIRVLIAKKTDENTAEDLKYDMEGYRKNYPDIQFKDIPVKHPEYRTYPKLLYIEDGFHEYVTYLNPGKKYPYLISVSMTIQKTTAGKEDMHAYSFVVESINALK
jgi:hypothetical protein